MHNIEHHFDHTEWGNIHDDTEKEQNKTEVIDSLFPFNNNQPEQVSIIFKGKDNELPHNDTSTTLITMSTTQK